MKQTKAIAPEASAQEKLLEGMKSALDEAEGFSERCCCRER